MYESALHQVFHLPTIMWLYCELELSRTYKSACRNRLKQNKHADVITGHSIQRFSQSRWNDTRTKSTTTLLRVLRQTCLQISHSVSTYCFRNPGLQNFHEKLFGDCSCTMFIIDLYGMWLVMPKTSVQKNYFSLSVLLFICSLVRIIGQVYYLVALLWKLNASSSRMLEPVLPWNESSFRKMCTRNSIDLHCSL